jgi:hypothetical protein
MSECRIRVRCSTRLILNSRNHRAVRKLRETFGTKAEMRVSVSCRLLRPFDSGATEMKPANELEGKSATAAPRW